MPLLRFGRSLRLAGADADTSIVGGTLWGFVSIWATSLALGSVLGHQAPARAEGGLTDPGNILFFIALEMMTGAFGGMVTLHSESRSATFRLAIVAALAGGAIAVLASGTPNVPVSGGFIFVRSLLHAGGVLAVALLRGSPVSEPRVPESTESGLQRGGSTRG